MFSTDEKKVIDHLLTTTRTVRKRLDVGRVVPLDLVLECLQLALQAPTGSALENWRWIVVADPEQRAALARCYMKIHSDEDARAITEEYQELTAEAAAARDPQQFKRVLDSVRHLTKVIAEVPVLVVACLEMSLPPSPSSFLLASSYGSIIPAIWSFQLALRSRGLASAYTTTHLAAEHNVAAALGIPDGVIQAAMIPIAYPIGEEFRPARRRPLREVVYWDRWGRIPPDVGS